MNFGWIEIVFFYGVALGILGYQYFKSDRALKKLREEREAKEKEAENDAE